MTLLMSVPDWKELTWYHYLVIGDVVVILALLLYFASRTKLKMPAIILGILGGVGVGAALGAGVVLAMIALNVQMDKDYASAGDGAPGSGGGPPGMGKGGMGKGGMGKGGMGKGGMGKGGMGKGGGSGSAGFGPTSQAQLASLVAKLDLLTHKPLAVTLDAEQKKKVRETLQKMDEEKELKEDEAKTKLEDLKKILNEDQLKTLEAAGYRWPGQSGGGRGGPTPPNPFSEGENKQHLQSLLAELK
jgi:hypothetical protein